MVAVTTVCKKLRTASRAATGSVAWPASQLQK
jgi:hypothetical protein